MFSIEDIMSTDLVTVAPDSTLDQVRSLMQEHRIRHVPVVSGEQLVGLITQNDVLAATESFLRDDDSRIKDQEIGIAEAMVTGIATVDLKGGLRQAAMFLEKNKIGCLPVLDAGKLVGIITDSDFVGVAINLLEQLEESEPVAEAFDDED